MHVHNFELWDEMASEAPLVPTKINLLPAGDSFEGRDGRAFESAEFSDLLAEFQANGMDLPIDIEHATEIKAPNGEAAPAVGWIKSLSMDANGVWGDVEWNDAGRALVESKQYRYISPVFEIESKTKRVKKLVSAALTNRPNLFLKSLNTQQEQQTIECNPAHEEQNTEGATPMADDVKKPEVVAEANAAKAGGELKVRMVPEFELHAHAKRAEVAEDLVKVLSERLLQVETNHEIEKALRDSKITPASENYYREMCSTEKGLAQFKAFIAEQKPIVSKDFSAVVAKLNPEKSIELNAQERDFCTKYGFSEAEYMKVKIAEHKRANGRA